MADEVYLDNFKLVVTTYEVARENNRTKLSIWFNVSHEQYHDVTTLLYKGNFRIKVPESKLDFHGTIVKYATSVTNLYKQGETGEFNVVLLEDNVN